MSDAAENAPDLTPTGSQWDIDTDEGAVSSQEKEVAKLLAVTLEEKEEKPAPEPDTVETKEVVPDEPEEEKEEEPAAKAKAKEEEKPPEGEYTFDSAKKDLRALLDKLPEDQRQKLLGTEDKAFAALTAKNQRAREREEAAAARERQLEQQAADNQKVQEGLNEAIKRARENPVEALKLMGWSFEEAARFVMNDEKVPEEKKRQMLEKTWDERMTRMEKMLAEREEAVQKAEGQAAVEGHLANVKGQVVSGFQGDKYPIAKRFDPEDITREVWEIQQKAYVESGNTRSLTTEQCLDILEENLQKQVEFLVGSGSSPQRTGAASEAAKTEGNGQVTGHGTETLTGHLTAQRGITPRVTEPDWDTDDDDIVSQERSQLAAMTRILEADKG